MIATWFRPDKSLGVPDELGDETVEFDSALGLEMACDASFESDHTALAFEVACLRNRAKVYFFVDPQALSLFGIRMLSWSLGRENAEAAYAETDAERALT